MNGVLWLVVRLSPPFCKQNEVLKFGVCPELMQIRLEWGLLLDC
jgi:hypothetical protein